MPQFTLDDQLLEFEKGERVLEVALRNGLQIPHFCYHPALSVVATCRMCLIDIVDYGNGRPAPKLQTACSTEIAPNMKVVTQNDKVREGRELVMEFLLINHPLDCPVCDQSGECTLQDYSNEYGSGASEMEYTKRVYGYRDIGSFITLERNRCIHCTRCERFTEEITGTEEFGVFNRGHQLTVDTFTDRPMTNKFQGNMADICPVGCITEKEFRFKKRVWHLKQHNNICVGCSTGCNITVETSKNVVYRFKPRENHEVNRWWMCDEGRMTYRWLNETKGRLTQPLQKTDNEFKPVEWEQAFQEIVRQIRQIAPTPEQMLTLSDTNASNEELFLAKHLMQTVFDSDQVFCPMPEWSQPESNYFINTLITTDKSPNRAGAELLGWRGDSENSELKQVLEQGVKVVFVLGNPFKEDFELRQRMESVELMVHIGLFHTAWSERSQFVLAGRNHAEKEATFINKNKRIQKTTIALRAAHQTLPQWLILAGLLDAFGTTLDVKSAGEVFDLIGEYYLAFKGITFEQVGELGINANLSADVPPILPEAGEEAQASSTATA